jgi:hypothetical protein
MKKNKITSKKRTVPRRCAVAAGSPLWRAKNKLPRRKGWYITRTEDGFISWRAWGHGSWWRQIKGGWIEFFGGDGYPTRYDWQPRSRQSIDLDSDKLPDLANDAISQPEDKPTNT